MHCYSFILALLCSCLAYPIWAQKGDGLLPEQPYIITLDGVSTGDFLLSENFTTLRLQKDTQGDKAYQRVCWVEPFGTDSTYLLRTGGGRYVQQITQEGFIHLGERGHQETQTQRVPATPASFQIETQASGQVLLRYASPSTERLYLNMFYGQGGALTLWTGTGDASRWVIKDVHTGEPTHTPQADRAYYIISMANGKTGQYVYYDREALYLKVGAEGATQFSFTPHAEGQYTITNITAKAPLITGAKQQNIGVKTHTIQEVTQEKLTAQPFVLYAGTHTLHTPDGRYALQAQGDTILAKHGVATASRWNIAPYTGTAWTPTFPFANTYYTLRMSASPTEAICATAEHTLQIATYDNTRNAFWHFVPAGKPHQYYIRNAKDGLYMQSTAQATLSTIQVGTERVPYYIGMDNTPGSTTQGYYYLCSTDQPTTNVSSTTLGLNKNGGGNNIIAYAVNTGNRNSYWSLRTTPYLYEERTFIPQDSLGQPSLQYALVSQEGLCMGIDNDTLTLQVSAASALQNWYFVGASNEAEGYLIASAALPGKTLNRIQGQTLWAETPQPTRWYIRAGEGTLQDFVTFIPYAQRYDSHPDTLTVAGAQFFTISERRSALSMRTGIYNQPCGLTSDTYLSRLKIGGNHVLVPLEYTADRAPQAYYTIYTQQKAIVPLGQTFDLNLSVQAPRPQQHTYVYIDWDADGIFEKSYADTTGMQDVGLQIPVPSAASTRSLRIRIRLTDTETPTAEDDGHGRTYDFILRTAPASDLRVITVGVNDPNRGVVMLDPVPTQPLAYGTLVTAHAQPQGDANFLYWKVGHVIRSTEPNYQFVADQDMHLVAFFSPNTQTPLSVASVASTAVPRVQIRHDAHTLYIITPDTIGYVHLYNTQGRLVLRSDATRIGTHHLSPGTYIVSIQTAAGHTTTKVQIP